MVKITRELIESVVGPVTGWCKGERGVQFRTTTESLSLALITKLSVAIETDRINFNLGYSGEEGYSEDTPGSDGGPGYIEILIDS